MIENDNWDCRKKNDNIVCEEKGDHGSKKVTMESGRGRYATLRQKTDRGDDITATGALDSIRFSSNHLTDVRVKNGRVAGSLE